MNKRTKKWLKGIGIVLLTPLILLIILSILLYLPPVQNELRKHIMVYASHSTGMNISIDNIRLTFPLNLTVHKVMVISSKDTLLVAGRLDVGVGVWRLMHGQIPVSEVTLNKVSFNSSNLVKGMQARGVLGELFLRSDLIDLRREEAFITKVILKDASIKIALNDTAQTPKEKASKPIRWKLFIQQLQLRSVSLQVVLPSDTVRLSTGIQEAVLRKGEVDLHWKSYRLAQFSVAKGSFNYDSGHGKPLKGFDSSHLALKNISISVDSFMLRNKELAAVVRHLSLVDRSGLRINSLQGRVLSDHQQIRIPALQLASSNSFITLSGKVSNTFMINPDKGNITSSVVARIGKKDLLLFAGNLPNKFQKAYPSSPLIVRASVQGNLSKLRLSQLKATLSGTFALSGKGEMKELSDSLKRSAQINFGLYTQNLNFFTSLLDSASNKRVHIPLGMKAEGKVSMKGNHYFADLALNEDKGEVKIESEYNGANHSYLANVAINNLQINHFLPKDSIYSLTASFYAVGEGTDVFSPLTELTAGFDLQELQFRKASYSGFTLQANLKNSLAKVNLSSNNELLTMDATLTTLLRKKKMEGDLSMNVQHINLQKLGFLDQPLKDPFAFTLDASIKKKDISLQLRAGDLKLSLASSVPIETFVKQVTVFSDVLMKQIKKKKLNQTELRKRLPATKLLFSAGRENPLSKLLSQSNISFQDASFNLTSSQASGLNGTALFRSLTVDSLVIDTVRFIIIQDSAGIHLRARMINNLANKQAGLKVYANVLIRNDNADLLLKYVNAKGETGTYLGVRARIEDKGISFRLFPDEPILVFRPFHLNKDNRIFIGDDKRITGNMELQDNNGVGIFIHSVENTQAQQDILAELRNINLKEIVQSFPYLPDIGGQLSAKVEYIQKQDNFQVISDADLQYFSYQSQPVGDLRLDATYLPGKLNEHQLLASLKHNQREVFNVEGVYRTEKQPSMNIHAKLKNFPLGIANPFIPNGTAHLSGALNGDITVGGSPQSPEINGQFVADTTSVYIAQAGMRLRLEEKAIKVVNSRLVFDNYSIYAVGKTPLSIAGEVNFKDLQQISADLKLKADNFQLLDASRTKESLVYGKVFVDINTTLRGPLDELVMRGNISLLGSSDVTYILKDSPLTVQDRLGDMVTFVKFSDTLPATEEKPESFSLGGLDMLINIHIDPTVSLKADLSPDRESRVELQGGGDLSLQYTPQGDLLLYGRYLISDGLLKYTLPVIPLKTFTVQDGSFVEWSGNVMEPKLNFKAVERVRATVTSENQSTRQVNFNVSISVANSLKDLALVFDLEAPEDMTIQNQLSALTPEERSRQAITMLATGMYMPSGSPTASSGGINVGNALNTFLQNEITNIVGGALNKINISIGSESYDENGVSGSGKRTDYTFRFARKFYNDRIQVVIGGRVSTGQAADENESFIDNISLEYRLDAGGTKSIKLFHNKNYESLLEGEITETGLGIVFRKKMRKLGDLFIFKKKEDKKDSK